MFNLPRIPHAQLYGITSGDLRSGYMQCISLHLEPAHVWLRLNKRKPIPCTFAKAIVYLL